jgi:putative ABC transport system permease protein
VAGGVDDELLGRVRALPNISDAQARTSVLARFQARSGVWRPLLLFVLRDFDRIRIATFAPESGAWPPPTGTILLERTVLPLFGLKVGDLITVRTPHGPRREIQVSGTVHDPGLAPAWQEQMGYGYITLDTLATLGEPAVLDELKLSVGTRPFDQAFVTRTTLGVVSWLHSQGREVVEVQVPPPGKHPHQGQMTALLTIFMVFGVLSLALSAILVATVISALLAKEVRQIGVMKALGGRTVQIGAVYSAMVAIIGAVAVAAGVPIGAIAGKAFSRVAASLLNFTIGSDAVPAWVFLLQAAAGIAMPLLISLVPIRRATRRTVREALSDYGVSLNRVDAAVSERPRRRVADRINRTLTLALRNTFRKRGRLALTVGLLAAGGATFTMALNVSTAWQRSLARDFQARHYDFEIRLGTPQSAEKVQGLLSTVPGVAFSEPWGIAPASLSGDGNVEITHTYPDGGHGSFSLRGVPEKTASVSMQIVAGRWLAPGDRNAAVLNPMARSLFPGVRVGTWVSLNVGGRASSWKIVGFANETAPASAYVPEKVFEETLAEPGFTTAFRVAVTDKGLDTRGQVIGRIENLLEKANIGVSAVIADAAFRNAISDHIYVLVFALVFMAVLMGAVGLLGLASTMSANVAERTREIGVMRAIGGTPGAIQRLVVAEAVFIGALSLAVVAVITVPLSSAVGRILGDMAFKTPLPPAVSLFGALLWVGIATIGSALSSALPAWRASRLTVRETLSYE